MLHMLEKYAFVCARREVFLAQLYLREVGGRGWGGVCSSFSPKRFGKGCKAEHLLGLQKVSGSSPSICS